MARIDGDQIDSLISASSKPKIGNDQAIDCEIDVDFFMPTATSYCQVDTRRELKRLYGKSFAGASSADSVGTSSGHQDAFGPAGEEKKKLQEIARKFEQKYSLAKQNAADDANLKRKYRFGRVEDHIDVGSGYDVDDDFIDDSEAYDELVPSTLTFAYGGFYVNQGKVEFRELSSDEEDVLLDPRKGSSAKQLKLLGKTKRRRFLDSDDEEQGVAASAIATTSTSNACGDALELGSDTHPVENQATPSSVTLKSSVLPENQPAAKKMASNDVTVSKMTAQSRLPHPPPEPRIIARPPAASLVKKYSSQVKNSTTTTVKPKASQKVAQQSNAAPTNNRLHAAGFQKMKNNLQPSSKVVTQSTSVTSVGEDANVAAATAAGGENLHQNSYGLWVPSVSDINVLNNHLSGGENTPDLQLLDKLVHGSSSKSDCISALNSPVFTSNSESDDETVKRGESLAAKSSVAVLEPTTGDGQLKKSTKSTGSASTFPFPCSQRLTNDINSLIVVKRKSSNRGENHWKGPMRDLLTKVAHQSESELDQTARSKMYQFIAERIGVTKDTIRKNIRDRLKKASSPAPRAEPLVPPTGGGTSEVAEKADVPTIKAPVSQKVTPAAFVGTTGGSAAAAAAPTKHTNSHAMSSAHGPSDLSSNPSSKLKWQKFISVPPADIAPDLQKQLGSLKNSVNTIMKDLDRTYQQKRIAFQNSADGDSKTTRPQRRFKWSTEVETVFSEIMQRLCSFLRDALGKGKKLASDFVDQFLTMIIDFCWEGYEPWMTQRELAKKFEKTIKDDPGKSAVIAKFTNLVAFVPMKDQIHVVENGAHDRVSSKSPNTQLQSEHLLTCQSVRVPMTRLPVVADTANIDSLSDEKMQNTIIQELLKTTSGNPAFALQHVQAYMMQRQHNPGGGDPPSSSSKKPKSQKRPASNTGKSTGVAAANAAQGFLDDIMQNMVNPPEPQLFDPETGQPNDHLLAKIAVELPPDPLPPADPPVPTMPAAVPVMSKRAALISPPQTHTSMAIETSPTKRQRQSLLADPTTATSVETGGRSANGGVSPKTAVLASIYQKLMIQNPALNAAFLQELSGNRQIQRTESNVGVDFENTSAGLPPFSYASGTSAAANYVPPEPFIEQLSPGFMAATTATVSTLPTISSGGGGYHASLLSPPLPGPSTSTCFPVDPTSKPSAPSRDLTSRKNKPLLNNPIPAKIAAPQAPASPPAYQTGAVGIGAGSMNDVIPPVPSNNYSSALLHGAMPSAAISMMGLHNAFLNSGGLQLGYGQMNYGSGQTGQQQQQQQRHRSSNSSHANRSARGSTGRPPLQPDFDHGHRRSKKR